jgi:hypothetical protein
MEQAGGVQCSIALASARPAHTPSALRPPIVVQRACALDVFDEMLTRPAQSPLAGTISQMVDWIEVLLVRPWAPVLAAWRIRAQAQFSYELVDTQVKVR